MPAPNIVFWIIPSPHSFLIRDVSAQLLQKAAEKSKAGRRRAGLAAAQHSIFPTHSTKNIE
jgi:hypothetical protein